MSNVAVIAEKPSVARDIAKALGATQKGDWNLQGGGYIVMWAIRHLVSLAQPHEIRPEWKQWRRHLLPMPPEEWPLVVYDKTKDQFETVRKILNSPKVERVICATDAGREGELIFRYIYDAAECAKPVARQRIAPLTTDAIQAGLAALKDAHGYDGLGKTARAIPRRLAGGDKPVAGAVITGPTAAAGRPSINRKGPPSAGVLLDIALYNLASRGVTAIHWKRTIGYAPSPFAFHCGNRATPPRRDGGVPATNGNCPRGGAGAGDGGGTGGTRRAGRGGRIWRVRARHGCSRRRA